MMYIYWWRCFSTGLCAKLGCLSRLTLTLTLTLMLTLTLTWSGSITTQGGSELLRRLWSEPCGTCGRGWQVARGGGQDEEGQGEDGSDCDCEGECKGRVL